GRHTRSYGDWSSDVCSSDLFRIVGVRRPSSFNPGFAWGDGLSKGIGHGMKELGRRTPTILNLAWAELLFWDGRASSLEEQALGRSEERRGGKEWMGGGCRAA